MSEQGSGAIAPNGGAAPSAPATQAPSTAQPATAQAPTAAPETKAPEDPHWLPGRLNQAKDSAINGLLSELGVKDSATLKANLARLSELETASLTEQERVAKRLADLEPKAQKAERLEAVFKSVVEAEFSTLTESQQAAIDARANGDPEKRWELMQLAKAFAGAAPSQPPTAPATPATPNPATTRPDGAQKPPARSEALTPRQQYEAMRNTDPMRATIFYQLNRQAIDASPAT